MKRNYKIKSSVDYKKTLEAAVEKKLQNFLNTQIEQGFAAVRARVIPRVSKMNLPGPWLIDPPERVSFSMPKILVVKDD